MWPFACTMRQWKRVVILTTDLNIKDEKGNGKDRIKNCFERTSKGIKPSKNWADLYDISLIVSKLCAVRFFRCFLCKIFRYDCYHYDVHSSHRLIILQFWPASAPYLVIASITDKEWRITIIENSFCLFHTTISMHESIVYKDNIIYCHNTI